MAITPFPIGILSIPATPEVTTASYCQQPGDMLSLIGVSFALMILLLSLFWMAAQLFKRPEYEGFVSIEIHQLVVSAILTVTIFAATLFSCELAVAFAGSDPFTLATGYLNYVSNNIALKAVLSLEALKMFAQYWGSMSFRWGLTVWGIASPSFPSFIIVERLTDFLLMLVTPFTASLMVQQIILEVIKGIAVAFILPAGLVLRMFPPTRGAGSFLIAAAIGFEIIYPFTYIMHRQIAYELMKEAELEKTMAGLLEESQLVQGTDITGISMALFFDMKTMLWSPIDALGFLLLQALFLPALSITLTVSFIKGLAKFLSQKMD